MRDFFEDPRWPQRDHTGKPVERLSNVERRALKKLQDQDVHESLKLLKGVAWGVLLSMFFWMPIYFVWIH